MKLTRVRMMLACLLLLVFASWAAADDKAARLKERIQRENNPIKRAELQVELAEKTFDEAARLYEKGQSDQGLATLQEMLAMVTEAHDGLFSTGRDPRKKPKGFKKAEIKLRELARKLEDLRVSLPTYDREDVRKVIERVSEMHENLLYGIMRVKEARQ